MTQKVLVIAADPTLRARLQAELGLEALELRAVDTLAGALALAAEDTPDLILLDSELPDATGLDACGTLKESAVTERVPVIYLAPARDVPSKVRAFDLGAVDCVSLPFEPAELRARVRAALRTKRFQDLLAARSQVDGLTGLRNRAWFDNRIQEAAAACTHRGTPYCLVMIDIDRFKEFNDRYGHPVGDRVLQTVAEHASAGLRSSDALCKYGGDEFALVHIGKGQASGLEIARRVQERLAGVEPSPRGIPERLTASLGVAGSDLFPTPHDATADRILAAADEALYEAKRQGRDRIVEATPATATRLLRSA